MSFQPVVPFSGFAGWSFLNRTMDSQREAFDNSSTMQRKLAYFEENIGNIQSAEDLVADRRLLEVALGAFGLDEDINNKYYIQKVLEDGSISSDALGNRLSDKRYLEFSKAFGFGDFDIPRTVLSDFPGEISDLFKSRQFEIAIGETDQDFRLALSLERALDDINSSDTTDNGKWFQVMGQPAVREVFETALGLPSSFGALDIDQQLTTLRDQLGNRFGGDGEINQFKDAEKREELVRLFLVRSQIDSLSSGLSNASAALQLLQDI